MTIDQTVARPDDMIAEAPEEKTSTSSFLAWCTLDVTGRALICAPCDVSWLSSTGETCWVCDGPGKRVGDLRR